MESAWVKELRGLISNICAQIDVAALEFDRIFPDEPLQCRAVEACPVEVQPRAVVLTSGMPRFTEGARWRRRQLAMTGKTKS